MSVLLRELIDIPTEVHAGDFVLKLTDGVSKPAETLGTYVVTEQVANCFDRALELIRAAFESNASMATYLHGSFGSGKSHFMAVLHLLLQQNPDARALEGLEAVVTQHDVWLAGKKFLLVPFHMIGNESMEEAVLGGYARRVRELHPDARVPGVYRAEGLFADAQAFRERLGDVAFFETLNEGRATGGGSGWGDLAGAWDAERFETALVAAPGSEERSHLIGALVQNLFKNYAQVAGGSVEAYVSLDEGLAEMSRHARELGYDALILFLDELILWLATHAGDLAFLNREGPKISKLVEAQHANRPIPIVSFIARQRDLRDMLGEKVTGVEQLHFAGVLEHWKARFETITLEDRNLPEIAARRLLKPKNEAARQQIDDAYRGTEAVRAEVFDALLGPHADRASFRKTYPFSPALIETLITVSAMLQRERTALKSMLQLLVEQRDTLMLGEIVPVGDLFDVIAEGSDPITEDIRLQYENARRLYRQKLLPLLEAEAGLTKEQALALPREEPSARAFRANDRLLKTLLTSALAPELPVLHGLTGARLAALNHGSIRTPVAGREGQEVIQRLRRWVSDGAGEIRISEGVNPTVHLETASVDTESILAAAESIDNQGNRSRKVRELLFADLDIEDREDLLREYVIEIEWRGTKRKFQVVYANVREMNEESFATRGDEYKLLIDYPFDEAGHSPTDDIAKLQGFLNGGRTAHTLAWIPSFLSDTALKDLGKLVRLDHVLAGERFRDYAKHLSAIEQASARALLSNQRSQLQERIRLHLRGAYGADEPSPGSVNESHSVTDHFQSLEPTFTPRPPAGANLRAALEHLLGQMLQSQYPAHPEFGAEITRPVLRRVYDEVQRAIADREGRVLIEKKLRAEMQQVAVPLRLGEVGETHFVLGRHWFSHFDRHAKPPVTVAQLRQLIDEPHRMGLPSDVQNLVLMVYADQANLAFHRHGGPWKATIESLPDDVELRPEDLPETGVWDQALARAAVIFGIAVSALRSASNASELAEELAKQTSGGIAEPTSLWEKLRTLAAKFGVPADAARLRSAEAVLALLRALEAAQRKGRIEIVARASVATSLEAMGRSFRSAAEVHRALEATKWELFTAITALPGDRGEAALAVRAKLVEVLTHDEYAQPLAPVLAQLEREAIRLLTPPAPAGRTVVERGSQAGLDAAGVERAAAELREKLASDPSLRVDLSWNVSKGPN